MPTRWFLPTVLVALILSGLVNAQIELERFQRQLEQIERETRTSAERDVPASQRAFIDYGGFITFNAAAIDDIEQETHILRQTTLSGYIQVNIDGVHEFFARASTSYLDFNSGDAFDSHGDDLVEPTLDRAHYRFDLGRYLLAYENRRTDLGVVVQGGRQLVYWVNGLTLSQVIDGGQVTFSLGPLSVATVAGLTRDSTTDFDSSRPGFDNETHRGFYGGMLSFEVTPRHRPFVYGLVKVDYNDDETLFTDVAGTPGDRSDDVLTKFDYDSNYIGVGSSGSIDDRIVYGIELVYEGGEGLSNSISPTTGAQLSQTREEIEAYAADLRLDYLMTDANRTRLSGELIIATGDSDRINTTTTFGGNKPGSTDRAFNAFGLINTGLAFSPNVSNLLLVRLGGSTFPLRSSPAFARLQVGTNLFIYNKFSGSAPTGEDDFTSPSKNRHYLGMEADIFANWQVLSDTSVTIRYGVFFPSSTLGTDTDERHFFFSGVTIAF